jgi:hypothetical protein
MIYKTGIITKSVRSGVLNMDHPSVYKKNNKLSVVRSLTLTGYSIIIRDTVWLGYSGRRKINHNFGF